MLLAGLIMAGDKPIGGSLSSAEQTHWLARLNAMMDSWSIERLMCYQLLEENFPLVSGTASYTIGSGGTFNTTRPTKINNAWVRDTSSYDQTLNIITKEQYDRLVAKSATGSYPDSLSYDPAYPLGTIYCYPKPGSGLTLYIESWKQLQQFGSTSTAIALPPGYQLAIESNFGVFACAGFRDPPAAVVKIAHDSKAAIKSLNIVDTIMRLDKGIAGRGRMNIIEGP